MQHRRMKISTAKTEVLHLSRNPDQCVLQVNGATLKQVEKFKYLGVAFTSDGRQDEELDTRIGKASAVMRALHYSVVMKRELSKKAKLSIFKAVFVPILTYGHESWIITERMRSQVQASEMRFLRRIEGVALFNKLRSSEIRKSLNIEPLLLRIERSQLRWFGHVSRMPQERLPKQALLAKANGRRPVGRPRTRWTDYIEDLGWNRLGLRPSEMREVMEDREVWRLNLELLSPQPSRKSGQWKKKKKNLFRDIGHRLSFETTCRRTALQLSEDELKRMRNAVHEKQIFLIVDESTVSGTQYLNILVGSLETPHVSYLYDCQPLQCAPNSNIIAQAVDDAIRNLEINRGFFCLLLSDAAKYMIAAGIILKSLYPKLFHVTCVAHLLHNRAIKIKSHFEDMDQLISKSKQ